METKNELKENITAKPDRNEVEGADTGCYRHVNQLEITPGVWTKCCSVAFVTIEGKSHVIAQADLRRKELHKNINLICAAPDLYEALTEVLYNVGELNIELDYSVHMKMINALNKAAGKTVD